MAVSAPFFQEGTVMGCRYRFVVFDIDGTLIDSSTALSAGFRALFEERRGRPMTAEEESGARGLAGMESLAAVGLDATQENLSRWLDLMFERYDAVTVFDGVPALLDALRDAGAMLGIVTSEDEDEMRRGFARFGLLPRFKHVVTAEATQRHKPYPDPLLAWLDVAGAHPEEALYVGDAPGDAACAAAAGVDFVQVTWGKPAAAGVQKAAPAALTFSSPGCLASWLCGGEPAETPSARRVPAC